VLGPPLLAFVAPLTLVIGSTPTFPPLALLSFHKHAPILKQRRVLQGHLIHLLEVLLLSYQFLGKLGIVDLGQLIRILHRYSPSQLLLEDCSSVLGRIKFHGVGIWYDFRVEAALGLGRWYFSTLWFLFL